MSKEYVEKRGEGYYVAGTRVSLDSVGYGFLRGRPGRPAATLSTMAETMTRVPRMQARPWQIAGWTEIRARQFM